MQTNVENYAHIKNFFKDLSFNEEKHLYTVNNERLPSVSGLIKNYGNTFDAKRISLGTAKKTGKSQDQILKEWDDTKTEACDRGHRVHLFGEEYPWDRTLVPQCPQEFAVKKFWDDMPDHIIPAFMELRMYHKTYGYAGTADILLFDTMNRNFILADYKTNKDLFKNFAQQTLHYPFKNFLDTPFSKYSLQLSYYQLLFEQTGSRVASRRLIWLDLKGNYHMYELPDLTLTLTQELAKRN